MLGGMILMNTMGYPSNQGQGFGQGPGFYPQVLAWFLILLGVLVVFQDIRVGRSDPGEHSAAKDPGQAGGGWLVLAVIVVCLISIATMELCGFLLSGFLLTLVTVRLIRGGAQVDNWFADLGFSACIIALVFLLFQLFLGIQLPQSMFLL